MEIPLGSPIDLSHAVEDRMPVYVGDPHPRIKKVKHLASDGVNLSELFLGSHTGTHVDAPSHFIRGGKTVDKLPAEQFVGEAEVLDLSSLRPGSAISAKDLETHSSLASEGDIILLYTGMSRRMSDPAYLKRYTHLSLEAARWLVKRKIKAVGIDCLGVEKFGSKEAPVHKLLLSNGVTIIESLSKNLKTLVGRRALLVCLPLKLAGCDGAPSRAIAYPL